MSDSQLWAELTNGSRQAFREIYDQNITKLVGYARKFTSETELIEDTIHDVFVQIWDRKATLGPTDSIIKYLCVTLRRELIRRLEKATQTAGFESAENKDIHFQVSQEDLLIHNENTGLITEKLHMGFETLSNRQKEAIFLKFYEELSYEEICEVMDINYQSVRNLISKGIMELRKFMVSVAWILALMHCLQ